MNYHVKIKAEPYTECFCNPLVPTQDQEASHSFIKPLMNKMWICTYLVILQHRLHLPMSQFFASSLLKIATFFSNIEQNNVKRVCGSTDSQDWWLYDVNKDYFHACRSGWCSNMSKPKVQYTWQVGTLHTANHLLVSAFIPLFLYLSPQSSLCAHHYHHQPWPTGAEVLNLHSRNLGTWTTENWIVKLRCGGWAHYANGVLLYTAVWFCFVC